jgi:hypothetical protein
MTLARRQPRHWSNTKNATSWFDDLALRERTPAGLGQICCVIPVLKSDWISAYRPRTTIQAGTPIRAVRSQQNVGSTGLKIGIEPARLA